MDAVKNIIVVVPRCNNKVLILKRVKTKRYDPGKWEFVSGFVEADKTLPLLAAEHLRKDTGLRAAEVLAGQQFSVRDRYGVWNIVPFLARVESESVMLDASHDAYRWVLPSEVSQYDYVAELDKNLLAFNLI